MQKCINQLDQTVENGATNSKIISLIPRECMNWEERKGSEVQWKFLLRIKNMINISFHATQTKTSEWLVSDPGFQDTYNHSTACTA